MRGPSRGVAPLRPAASRHGVSPLRSAAASRRLAATRVVDRSGSYPRPQTACPLGILWARRTLLRTSGQWGTRLAPLPRPQCRRTSRRCTCGGPAFVPQTEYPRGARGGAATRPDRRGVRRRRNPPRPSWLDSDAGAPTSSRRSRASPTWRRRPRSTRQRRDQRAPSAPCRCRPFPGRRVCTCWHSSVRFGRYMCHWGKGIPWRTWSWVGNNDRSRNWTAKTSPPSRTSPAGNRGTTSGRPRPGTRQRRMARAPRRRRHTYDRLGISSLPPRHGQDSKRKDRTAAWP